LAEATLEEVHSVWAGLGYYSRATRLHEVAKKVKTEFGGILPSTAKELMTFPGVGRYTAAAVASIAFGETASLVDGNVTRVLSRLRLLGSDSTSKSSVDFVWSLADQLTHPERPGDFNQALMELGATLCIPKKPKCGDCPLNTICTAVSASKDHLIILPSIEDCHLCLPSDELASWKQEGVSFLPRKAPKKEARKATSVVCVVEVKGSDQFLLRKRPPTGLLANLWEFPTIEGQEAVDSCKVSAFLMDHFGLELDIESRYR